MSWKPIRDKSIIENHDQAIPHFIQWWKKRTGRNLMIEKEEKTIYGKYIVDLVNNVEIIQFERRTSDKSNYRPWKTSYFFYNTLDDFKHKIINHLKIAQTTNKEAWNVQCNEDMTCLVIANYKDFDLSNTFMRKMPGGVRRECCSTYEYKFEQYEFVKEGEIV